jgi:hypothetical protein
MEQRSDNTPPPDVAVTPPEPDSGPGKIGPADHPGLGSNGQLPPPASSNSACRVTVAALAQAKALPEDFLRGLDLIDMGSEVFIRYKLADGSIAPRHRRRTAIVAREGSKWNRADGEIVPYGLWRLAEARERDFLVIVNGESDCWTLWYHAFPALGIPGSNMTKKLQAEHLQGIETVYLVDDPEDGRREFVSCVTKQLEAHGWKGKTLIVKLPDSARDPNALHQLSHDSFQSKFQQAMGEAQPLADAVPGLSKQYLVGKSCFMLEKKKSDVQLTNFVARIVGQIVEDDGQQETRSFYIDAQINGSVKRCRVEAAKFQNMRWVEEQLGAGAIVAAGSTMRDHARTAIQVHSGEVPELRKFQHTGWRKVAGNWAFLHAGGAVGAEKVKTALESEGLSRYTLPARAEDLRSAMRVSLALLGVGDRRVTYPLWGCVFRAPTCHHLASTVMPHFVGQSGAFKSSITAAALAHYGRFRTKEDHPGRWAFTDTILEKACFLAKDVLFVIDDLNPENTKSSREELEKKFSRIVGTVGDQTGRRRATSTLETRLEYIPRGVIISTGEYTPSVAQSRLARILPVPIDPGAISKQRLAEFQVQLDVLPSAMRGYLEYLRVDFDSLGGRTRERFERTRERVSSSARGHGRLAENIAHIHLGLELGCEFAVTVGALTEEEAHHHVETGLDVLVDLAEAQGKMLVSERPAQLFLDAIGEGLRSGRAYLADRETDQRPGDGPTGEKLGWRDVDGIYLMPKAAYRFVMQRLDYRGGVSISESMLKQTLKQEGYLLQNPSEKNRTEANKSCGGSVQRVLWLRPDCLHAEGDQ